MCDATGAQAPVATPAHFVNKASDTISTKRNIPLTGEEPTEKVQDVK